MKYKALLNICFLFPTMTMLMESCGMARVANRNVREDRELTIVGTDSVSLHQSLLFLTEHVSTLTDRSVIRITRYDPPVDSSCPHGTIREEIEIHNDIFFSDSSAVGSDYESDLAESTDSVLIENSEISVSEAPHLQWWQQALIWTGVAAILIFIIRVLWKTYKPTLL